MEVMHKDEVTKKYVIDEMSKFRNHDDLVQFVNTLGPQQIDVLCKWLSCWRRNSVFNNILNSPTCWSIGKIPISEIKIQKVNEKVNFLLERCDYLLEKVLYDKEICNHDEFKSQGNINDNFKQFIAIKEGNKYKIFDGIHRAVRLTCDGAKELELIYYENRI